jgi:hypothetical protein
VVEQVGKSTRLLGCRETTVNSKTRELFSITRTTMFTHIKHYRTLVSSLGELPQILKDRQQPALAEATGRNRLQPPPQIHAFC